MNQFVVGKNDRIRSTDSKNLAESSKRKALCATAMLGLSMLLVTQSVQGQDEPELLTDLRGGSPFEPQVGPTCSGGTAVDDGSIEQGYRIGASDVRLVQRLTPPNYPATLSRVCTCWLTGSDASSMAFNFLIYGDDGPGGTPGTLLGTVPSTVNIGSPFSAGFIGQDCSALGIQISSGGAYVGVQWDGVANEDLFVCADETPATSAALVYRSTSGGTSWQALTASFPNNRALLIRSEYTFSGTPDPEPPAGNWLTTAALPGFQFKSRIDGNRIATQVADCVPETLCLAGAIPTRTEVFVRIIGPRSNGFLWPEVIRFTIARVELWVQKTFGGPVNYYQLSGVSQVSDVLNGLVDRDGFLP